MLFPSENSTQIPLALFSDIVLKLSGLFQTDALTDWTLCYEQSLIFTVFLFTWIPVRKISGYILL